MPSADGHPNNPDPPLGWTFVQCPKNPGYDAPGWKHVKAFCPCGGLYFGGDRPKHCAHKLTDVLIKRGKLSPWPENCVCCPAGRPIVASEVRDYIFTDPVPDPAPDEAYYIFCIGPGSNGHVYYGTRSRCLEGTGDAESRGLTERVEYYASAKDYLK